MTYFSRSMKTHGFDCAGKNTTARREEKNSGGVSGFMIGALLTAASMGIAAMKFGPGEMFAVGTGVSLLFSILSVPLFDNGKVTAKMAALGLACFLPLVGFMANGHTTLRRQTNLENAVIAEALRTGKKEVSGWKEQEDWYDAWGEMKRYAAQVEVVRLDFGSDPAYVKLNGSKKCLKVDRNKDGSVSRRQVFIGRVLFDDVVTCPQP